MHLIVNCSRNSKITLEFKGALDKYNIIPQLFPKKVGIFIPLEMLAWIMFSSVQFIDITKYVGTVKTTNTVFLEDLQIYST